MQADSVAAIDTPASPVVWKTPLTSGAAMLALAGVTTRRLVPLSKTTDVVPVTPGQLVLLPYESLECDADGNPVTRTIPVIVETVGRTATYSSLAADELRQAGYRDARELSDSVEHQNDLAGESVHQHWATTAPISSFTFRLPKQSELERLSGDRYVSWDYACSAYHASRDFIASFGRSGDPETPFDLSVKDALAFAEWKAQQHQPGKNIHPIEVRRALTESMGGNVEGMKSDMLVRTSGMGIR